MRFFDQHNILYYISMDTANNNPAVYGLTISMKNVRKKYEEPLGIKSTERQKRHMQAMKGYANTISTDVFFTWI